MNEKLLIKTKFLNIQGFIRIISIVLLFSAFSISIHAQITINANKQRIEQVLKTIESKSEFKFFYNSKFADLNNKVTIEVVNQPIEAVMDILLSGTQLIYEKKEKNQIVLLLKPQAENAASDKTLKQISGIVSDGQGAPVIGASIVEKGTTNGAISDLDGKFSFKVNSDAILEVFYLGYISQEVSIKSKSIVDVRLMEDTQKLEEVVVVGYGTQARREITGSVTSITSKEFNHGFSKTAADLLQGKVAGLTVNSGSGDVTSNASIRLRGVSTLQNDQGPYVVIDGVPGGDMSTVSPQDIESISILKDASAAAIYGSRSAGGVILITTKKGSINQTKISYTGAVGVSTLANKPNLMSASKWREYTSSTPGKDGSSFDKGADTDWFDEITRTGVQQDHSLSLSGGGVSHNYRGAISYMQRDGLARDNYLQRYNARFQFTQWALNNKLQVSLTGVATITDESPAYTRNFLLAYNMLPVVPVTNPDGSWFESREYDQGNPVENQDENTRKNQINNFYGTLNLSYTIIDGLELKALLSKSRDSKDYTEYNSIHSEAGYNNGGFGKRAGYLTDKNLMEWMANYSKEIGAHKIGALAGYSWEQLDYSDHFAQNRNFITDLLQANDLASGQGLRKGDVNSSKNQSRLISFYTRLNYAYLGKYMLTATVRKDGSSKFGTNSKWGTFPSISAAWNISEEGFMGDIKWLNDLKFRVGYGVMGNQSGLDPYKTLALYGSAGKYYDNESWYAAYKISQNANPDLRWESTAMLNIGLDFSILNNRLGGRLEWYNKTTSDMLYTYPVPTPPYLYPNIMANVGDMQNKGIELSLTAGIIRQRDFSWDLSVNLSHNENKLTRLSNDFYTTESVLVGNVFWRGGSASTHILEVGRPIGQFYGLACTGLNDKGNYVFVDQTGEGEISDPADYTYIGDAQPDLTYGVNNAFRYKNFDFSFFFRGTIGNDIFNMPRLAFAQNGYIPGTNALDDPLTYQLKETPRYSSYYIEDGSFLRLDNLTLGYRFKGLNGMRINFTAQNLFVITDYKGVDPEVPIDTNEGLAPGIEPREFYPKARNFSIGLNLEF